MGEGLKRVAKLCGGLTATDGETVTRYGADGKVRPEPATERACDAAIEVLTETGNPAVMWGDEGLLHLIAGRLGWEHDAWKTSDRVLRALSKTPGLLRKGYTVTGGNRRVLIFRLPDPPPLPHKPRSDLCPPSAT